MHSVCAWLKLWLNWKIQNKPVLEQHNLSDNSQNYGKGTPVAVLWVPLERRHAAKVFWLIFILSWNISILMSGLFQYDPAPTYRAQGLIE